VRIGYERGLPPGWLNSDAKAYIPLVAPGHWRHLFRDGGVTVSTAPARMLLAMKLKANRGRRDAEDIARLLAVCKVKTVRASPADLRELPPTGSPVRRRDSANRDLLD
jgi:transposase